MKHTSGPWKFGKELTAHSGEWLISYDAKDKGQGICIAETRPGSGSEAANAQLIASAPDLLEALQSILPFIPVTSAKEGGASAYSENVRAADKVRAAIARATGETP